MILLRTRESLPESLRHGAVSIGNFDGVHRGHAELVNTLLAESKAVGGPAVAFTFDPHPASVLCPGRTPPPLSWTERKAALLAELGVAAVIAYPTDLAFLHLDANTFFRDIVLGRLAARAMVEGPNFFFGHDRSGDLDVLGRLCRGAGVELKVAGAVRFEGEIVSSSRIRRLVAEGDVETANRMLTQPYRIRGRVVRGAGRGRELGFPTANLSGVDTLLPGDGIYAGRAWVDTASWPAAISLGSSPTFDDSQPKTEIHLVGYEGALYDRSIEVDFLARLRDIGRFDGAESLIEQIHRDVEAVRQIAAVG